MTALSCSVKQFSVYNDPYDIIKYIMAAESSKFDCINLEIGPFERLLPFADWKDRIMPLIDYINQSQLKCICVHAPYITEFYFEDADEEKVKRYQDDLLKSIEICRMINCDHIVVHLASSKLGEDEKCFASQNLKILSEALSMAKKYHITLCAENHTNFAGCHGPTSNELNAICEYAAQKGINLMQCFDFGHANISSEGIDSISKFKYISVFHIHDNNGVEDLHNELGSGSINWSRYKKFFTQDKLLVSEVRYKSNADLSQKLNETYDKMHKLVK